jgi:hypothetical protein
MTSQNLRVNLRRLDTAAPSEMGLRAFKFSVPPITVVAISIIFLASHLLSGPWKQCLAVLLKHASAVCRFGLSAY